MGCIYGKKLFVVDQRSTLSWAALFHLAALYYYVMHSQHLSFAIRPNIDLDATFSPSRITHLFACVAPKPAFDTWS